MGVFGASQKTTLKIDLYDEKNKILGRQALTSSGSKAQGNFPGSCKHASKLTLRIQRPSNSLIRTGGEYEIELSGAVQNIKNSGLAQRDPIVKTYKIKSCNPNWGFEGHCDATLKFDPDGTFKSSDGLAGTWRIFDRDTNVYSLRLSGNSFSLKMKPAVGLVDPSDDSIVFQEIR